MNHSLLSYEQVLVETPDFVYESQPFFSLATGFAGSTCRALQMNKNFGRRAAHRFEQGV